MSDLSTYLYYAPSQEYAIVVTERVTSVISMLSSVLVIVTFTTSKRFRKPVNRILFYATLGNFLMNVGTLLSFDGIYAGRDSPLCQFQGFMIQMFLPADALWNLSMAINTYLAVFKKWPSSRLKRLDWIYFAVNYGCTFIVALVYCFIETADRGKMYGPAVLWCWIDTAWDVWRIVTCYAPAWIAIFASFCIYIACGVNIYRKRNQLQQLSATVASSGETPTLPRGHWSHQHIRTTTELRITSHHAPQTELDVFGAKDEEHGYVCTAEAIPNNPFGDVSADMERSKKLARAKLEANVAAVGYAKAAMLFFVSLLITWVPSSIFRVALVASPKTHIFPLAEMTSCVLCFQGMNNAIIYVATSRAALDEWFLQDLKGERFLVWLGVRKPAPAPEAVVWPPPMSPRARDRFGRKGSHTGSFDRLW